MFCKGYIEVSDKFLNSYDAIKSTSHIIYLDVNNLYGYSMKQLLLTEILDWVNRRDFKVFLEVDLDYLDYLGILTNFICIMIIC